MPVLKQKEYIASFFHQLGIYNSLSELNIHKGKEVLYLQNYSDKLHCSNHLLPFFKNQDNYKRLGKNTFLSNNLYFYIGDWGYGHVVPPRDILIPILKKVINNVPLAEICKDLSLNDHAENFIPLLTLEKSVHILDARISYYRGIKKLIIDTDFLNLDNIEYAIYFMKGDERAAISWYQLSNIFDIPECDFDSIQIFIKDFFDNRVRKNISLKYKYI